MSSVKERGREGGGEREGEREREVGEKGKSDKEVELERERTKKDLKCIREYVCVYVHAYVRG